MPRPPAVPGPAGPLALLVPLLVAALVLAPAPRAASEPAAAVELQGIARGAVLLVDGFWKWRPTEARIGVLGTFTAVSKEFEQKEIEVGADRSVFTAAVRVAFEADRAKRVLERGELCELDVKPTVSVARFKMKGVVYACAAKQLGRTAVFARASADAKDEAGLVRLLSATVATARSTADDVDGWIPPEVKTAWNRAAGADLIAIDDGTLSEEAKAEVVRVAKEAHALVRRSIAGSPAAPFPPVVRMTANRDLFLHLAGRREGPDALYVPAVGELLVGARSGTPDPAAVTRAAVEQMLHHSLGASNSEPVLTGLTRYALAVAGGAQPGALFPDDEAAALERLKSKAARPWGWILTRMQSVANYLSTDREARAIDAELCVHYLLHGGSQGKGSFPKWISGFRKFGHPDAAAEAAIPDLDVEASNAEFWNYWEERLAPKKKPGKPGSPPPKPPVKPPK